MSSPHIEVIVQLFVKKEKRERILSLGQKQKRRSDLRSDLLHDARSLDPAVIQRLTSADAAAVERALRGFGAAGRAYCISELYEIDDQELDLASALRAVVGRTEDSLVFAVGSRVAYYENHEGEQAILRRK